MSFNAKGTMKDLLTSLLKAKKTVYVILNSGKEYVGIILKVEQNLVVFQTQGKKNFYDAVIRIENITAVEVKVRGEKKD